MHLVRSGSGAEDVAALDPELIGHVQLADALLVPTIPDYMEEACFERMVPGTGELPLVDILAALPSDVVIGLEVPLRSQADLPPTDGIFTDRIDLCSGHMHLSSSPWRHPDCRSGAATGA
jgi:hypothetical protein